ncbi:hypothetical protein C8Q74DRAFT_1247257 [Fomes fomentarius]|nr:hypothetical protein C8Q74DRAFT_1247257 [Fomes fomentarius]
MCWNIITYHKWDCGFHQNTGRNRVDCRRRVCRLSDHHPIEAHDCHNGCVGTQTEDQHLVMEQSANVCQQCREAGRSRHPGIPDDDDGSGGIQYRYIVANYGNRT